MKQCTKCVNGTIRIGGCSGITDSICVPQTLCTDTVQYEVESATAVSNPTCANCSTSCGEGTYLLHTCSGYHDIVCGACAVCTSNEFEVAPCSSMAMTNRACQTTTVCDAVYECETLPPTATSDRVCTNCTVVLQRSFVLLGDAQITAEFGSIYVDPGYNLIVNNNSSKRIVTVTGLPVNTTVLGAHAIVYTVSDNANHFASINRVVLVVVS